MKKFILGLIIGIIISLSFTSFAAETITAFANRFPIYLNGIKQDVKAYIINDHLYLQVIDINKIFNTETSFDKDKNDETQNAIYIDSIKPTPKPTQTPTLELTQTPKPINNKEDDNVNGTKNTILTTPDGIEIWQKDDLKYITWLAFNNKYKPQGIELKFTINPEQWHLYKNGETILDNVELCLIYNFDCIEYDYYINVILPLIQ
ncbi:MAG: hypothetical protein ACFFDF_00350 [Candidatus Odinarchaeota archaeon]